MHIYIHRVAIFTVFLFEVFLDNSLIWMHAHIHTQARDFARFYVLETVARVPYFSYMSLTYIHTHTGSRFCTVLRAGNNCKGAILQLHVSAPFL
jgi:hypothetical protein